LRSAIEGAKTALAGSDAAAIKTAAESLERERMKFGEAVYRAAAASGASGGSAGPSASPQDAGKPADDVIDAEVVDSEAGKK
jgi:molecular chaperone DnaK